jgi:glycosyltransferase involved in cell wall biosynthesis
MKRALVVHQCRPPGTFHDRQRGPMYEPYFRGAGFDVQFVGRHPMPPFSNPRTLFQKAMSRSLAVKAWARGRDAVETRYWNGRVLSMAKRADVVVLVKVDSPDLVRAIKRETKARVVYDLVDTVWRTSDGGTNQDKIDVLAEVDAITVCTAYGLEYAKRFGPPVYLWPTASYVETFDERRATSPRGKTSDVVIGWVGSHSTAASLYLTLESIEDVARRHPEVRVRLLGVPHGHDILWRFEHARVSATGMYDTREMIDEVLAMDIGLYPMFDLEDSGLHGLTKALIYMGGGAVVVASPVWDRKDLLREGETGFFARARAEWTEKLEQLVVDADLRERVRAKALETVRAGYSLERCFEGLLPALGKKG